MIMSCCGFALFWHAMLGFKTKRVRFCIALAWFASISGFHLNWFFSDRYVGIYIYFFMLFLLFGFGLQFGLLSLFIRKPNEMGMIQMLAISGGWTLCEWSRLHLLSGFSFDPVGLALSSTSMSMQMASAFGVYGLSFWIMFTNLLALRLFHLFSKMNGCIWLIVALIPYLFGCIQLSIHAPLMAMDQTPPLKTLLVQTALLPEQKQEVNHSDPFTLWDQWERVLGLLSSHRPYQPELIVLPEGFVPYGTDSPIYPIQSVLESFKRYSFHPSFDSIKNDYVGNRFWSQTLANLSNADLIVGLEDFEVVSDAYQAYNAAFLFRPQDEQTRRYAKRILVPMGEYIPFTWCKKILSKYGISDSYAPGKEATLLHTARVVCGVSICYEETYGQLMLESRKKGARMHVNLTNDAWYPRSRLPMIHFLHGRFRAIESGIPQIRACNTGVTCAIDALGRVVDQLPCETEKREAPFEALAVNIPLYQYVTFYSLWGDQPVIYFSSILFSWLCVFLCVKRKQFTVNGLDIYPLQKN